MGRIVAVCARCGAEHDPYVTGEWLVCSDCEAEALTEHSEARVSDGASDTVPVLIAEIERLRNLVRDAHWVQRSTGYVTHPDGSRKFEDTHFCRVCDWCWQKGSSWDCLLSHRAHVEALLNTGDAP